MVEISNLPKKTDFMEASWLTAWPSTFHLVACCCSFRLFGGYFSAIKLIPGLKHGSLRVAGCEVHGGTSTTFISFLLCRKWRFGWCVAYPEVKGPALCRIHGPAARHCAPWDAVCIGWQRDTDFFILKRFHNGRQVIHRSFRDFIYV